MVTLAGVKEKQNSLEQEQDLDLVVYSVNLEDLIVTLLGISHVDEVDCLSSNSNQAIYCEIEASKQVIIYVEIWKQIDYFLIKRDFILVAEVSAIIQNIQVLQMDIMDLDVM